MLMPPLMGETSGCGMWLAVVVGEGVLSVREVWKPEPEPAGLAGLMPRPRPEAVEVCLLEASLME